MENVPEKVNASVVTGSIIELAKDKSIDVEKIDKLLEVQIKLEERQAERSYNEAYSLFQASCPIIIKTKAVSFKSTNYSYCPLDEMVHQIKPMLTENDLTYAFDMVPSGDIASLITTISHKDGHSKNFGYMFDPVDNNTGSMNPVQRRKSALSYAKRASLENALGLVVTGEDDDATRAFDNPVSESQIDEIRELLKGVDRSEEGFLVYLNKQLQQPIESLVELSEQGAKKAVVQLKAMVKK